MTCLPCWRVMGMSELKKGWKETVLGEVIKIKNGYAFSTSEYRKSGVPLIRQSNLNHDTVDLDNCIYLDEAFLETKKSFILKKNDILIGMSGSVGKLCIYDLDIPALQNQRTGKVEIRENSITNSKFIWLYLCTVEAQLKEKGKGLGVSNVSAKDIESLPIVIPPINIQEKIVERLELLLGKINKANERLEKIPAILKRLRQSVLASACSGKLTADWREENEFETAKEVLNEILLKRNNSNRKQSPKVKSTNIGIDYLGKTQTELPKSWCWTSLANYATCSRGRFSVRPRNDPRYFNGEYPFIQIGDLPREGGFINYHTQTLNDMGLGVSKIFSKGTVVIAIVGATIANTGILSYDMCFPDSLVGIETGTITGNRYIEYYLRSVKEDIRQVSYAGGGQPNIKLETLEPYPVPLPSLSEQEEIVRRVDRLFALADKIELRYKNAKAQLERAERAIYAKAFRGELVTNEK